MATNSAATVMDAYATMGGVRYQLNITVRIGDDAPANLSSEKVQGMVAHTIATWQRAMDAVLTDTWHIAEFGGKVWPSAEEKQGVTVRNNHEPYVTVWNRGGAAVNITVHSWDNGVYALETAKDMLAGLEKFKEYANAFGFEAFEFASLHKAATNTPKPTAAPKRDIDDVDSFLNGDSESPHASTKQGNVYVRPAMAGTIPNTIKLQKGAKGKETFEMAILPTTPYSSNAADFQEKDLIAYPIQGAIRYEGGSSGFYFAIPVPQSEIRVYVREATNFDGKTIESDSQKLVQHLGLKDMELSQGMKWNVPATHIAMKVGKTGDKGQYKNYVGLYELK